MGTNWKVLSGELVHFLIRGDRVPPFLVFFQLGYLTMFGPLEYSTLVLVASVVFGLVQRVNYFWYVGIIIQPSLGYLAIPNILMGLVSCN